jgi:serine/threonine-protein kinase HipA
VNLYCDEIRIGDLRLSGSAWRLQFARRPAVPMSPHFEWRKGAIFESQAVEDFFVNYLPEEPFAERVAARISPRPRSLEDWFIALGQELTGAYALTPADVDLASEQYFDLPEHLLFEGMRSSRSRADAIAFTLNQVTNQPRLSLAGAQDKFALWFDPGGIDPERRFKIPQGRAASTHIFKPESSDARYPMLPANEYACAQLARLVGLSVAKSSLLTLGGVRTLVTERFDRRRRGGQVRRIHQIDLCQLLNLPRARKYGSQNAGIDTEQFFESCALLSVPALARRTHLRSWLFNFLIGNQDAHAKNYSFLYLDGWRTAPLYDLLSVIPYLPDQSLSMGLLNEYRPGWFERKHWVSLARLAGVTDHYLAEEIRGIVQRMKEATDPLEELLRARLSDDELDFLASRVNPVIGQRAQYLHDAVASLRA